MQVTGLLEWCIYAEWCILIYAYLGLSGLLIIISKLCGLRLRHDDIRHLYFVYFVIFALNFFINSIIFTMKIFEQQLIILGVISSIIVVLNKFAFDIWIIIKSERIWTQSPFISKQMKSWFKNNEIQYTVLSFFFGPIASITFSNSRLFEVETFCMGVPYTMIIHFISNMFWKTLLLQRVPELFIQFTYLMMHELDQYLVFAFITTMSTLLVSIHIKYQSKHIELLRKHFIHDTGFLMEIESDEIIKKSKEYLRQPNAFKSVIAEILEVPQHTIELPLFEGIYIDKECECSKKKVPKCYGLKMYITVNTIDVSRRMILMKLKEAQTDTRLVTKLMEAWQLEDEPFIQEIEMLYNFHGDLVIPRSKKQARSYSVLPMTINLQQKRLILVMDGDKSEPDL